MATRLIKAAKSLIAAIIQIFRWWFRQIARQDTLRAKLVVFCVGLLALCVVCSVPVTLINGPRQTSSVVASAPSTRPTTAEAAAPTLIPTTKTLSPAATPTDVPTATTAPTDPPTATPEPTFTATAVPTNTPEPTNTPKPTAKPTAVPKPIVAPKPKPQPTTVPQPLTGVRVGAICRDGTRSSATGRGACSHHGGVAQWLYR